MRSVADAIVHHLVDAGVTTIFGVPGGGSNLDLIAAAGRAGLRFVLTATETAAAIHGVGTGSLSEHWTGLTAAEVPIFLSGMSSKARGIEGSDGIELCPPTRLVELADWAEKLLTY